MKSRSQRKHPDSLSSEEEGVLIDLLSLLRKEVRRARRSIRGNLAETEAILAELRAGRERRRSGGTLSPK